MIWFVESCAICRGDFDSNPGSSRCMFDEYLAPWMVIYWAHQIHRRLAHPWAGYDWEKWFHEVFHYDLAEVRM